ncbi:hypothetical protein PLICRDRAFT_259077 [Plicaturopsis crispa FD-325 SS-3]|nr:hypothetical protein PLICRDRAFT_259077 [Plicaturopsis crispa FD-325 SS-3]
MMSGAASDGLPIELVLRILRFAAASSTETSLALTLVAGWTRRLAIPYLLSTVVIRSRTAASAFIRFLDQDPRRAPLVENASLAFDGDGRGVLCCDIIGRCQNLTNVAMFSAPFYGFVVLYDTHTPPRPPRTLHITVPDADHEARGVILFVDALAGLRGLRMSLVRSYITRLDVAALAGWSGRDNAFGCFPHLTHLRVAFEDTTRDEMYNVVTVALEENTRLEILVLSVDDARYRDDVAFAEWFWGARDRLEGRLYATSARNNLEEWERVARAGEDIWEDAIRETEDWRRSRASTSSL